MTETPRRAEVMNGDCAERLMAAHTDFTYLPFAGTISRHERFFHGLTEGLPDRPRRGVDHVLIVPCTNHPVLQEDSFVVYFQLVTDHKL